MLEQTLKEKLFRNATLIQKTWRMYECKKKYRLVLGGITSLQTAVRALLARKEYAQRLVEYRRRQEEERRRLEEQKRKEEEKRKRKEERERKKREAKQRRLELQAQEIEQQKRQQLQEEQERQEQEQEKLRKEEKEKKKKEKEIKQRQEEDERKRKELEEANAAQEVPSTIADGSPASRPQTVSKRAPLARQPQDSLRMSSSLMSTRSRDLRGELLRTMSVMHDEIHHEKLANPLPKVAYLCQGQAFRISIDEQASDSFVSIESLTGWQKVRFSPYQW